jgi:TolB-like protein/DNA-binding winged helix-turn-helix (wHTH) protein
MEANDQIAAALASSDPVSIGKWTFHADSLLLECRDNRIKLEPRVAYLLYYLAENAGSPVSRAELTDHVWSGLVVGDEALTGAINKLRNAFGDDSHHPEVIKTIPKVGYQLIADVEFPNSVKTADRPEPAVNNKLVYAGYALIALLVIAGTHFTIQKIGITEAPPALKPPDKPSIAVLPFTNMSNEVDQDYFADGMTEDLITDLSKVSGLFVISRNSVFTYKDKAVKIRQIAEELGVRYVLEGSVRKVGNQVRINTQLIDADTGGHVWADRYDGTYEDVFSLQDKVTGKIVTTLAIKLAKGEQDQITKIETTNTKAYDAFLRGWEQYQRHRPESSLRAIEFFEEAARLDPDYSRAYAALSATYWQGYKRYWSVKFGLPNHHESRYLAEQYLAQALKNPSPLSYQVSASILAQRGFHSEAISNAEHAIAMDPNDANGYSTLAGVLNLAGQPREALSMMERAIRLNPHYPTSYLYEIGLAQFGIEDFKQAATSFEKAIAINPEDRWSSRLLVAALGYLGRKTYATQIINNTENSVLWLDPLSVRSIVFWYPFKNLSDTERLAEGLRKAGVPD